MASGIKVTSGMSLIPFAKKEVKERSRFKEKVKVLVWVCNAESLL